MLLQYQFLGNVTLGHDLFLEFVPRSKDNSVILAKFVMKNLEHHDFALNSLVGHFPAVSIFCGTLILCVHIYVSK